MCAQSATSSTVVTVGNFDGVHCGHQALVIEARRMAGADGQVIVLVFDPHPRFVLSPDLGHPAKLSTFPLRRQLLLEYGANLVHQLTPTPNLLNQSPSEFVEMLMAEYRMTAMIEGPDFCFGRNRTGNVETLRQLGQERHFGVRISKVVKTALSDQLIVKASSSMVRRMIRMGRMRDAAMILGRPYRLVGEVVQGDGRGRTIGFPTANVHTEFLMPASGVYGGRARCIRTACKPGEGTVGETGKGTERDIGEDTEGETGGKIGGKIGGGDWYRAAVNIGTRPTFGKNMEQTCEVHLIGYDGEIGSYGWEIEVEFHTFLRDEIRFGSVEAVVGQIERDIDRVRTLSIL